MEFKKLSSKLDFPELEKKVLRFWERDKTLRKYLDKNNDSTRRFSFLDGPITANNPMGVHHAWGRTLKDLYQRYKNMQGFKQRFQNGFDNQGLWVEVEVEKKLGFKCKRDIEEYGIDKFVERCKEHTLRFAEIQTNQSKRLGYFMNWDDSYYTMSDENNFAIWHFLKICWKNGWLYKGEDVVPWCPRCGTAISQHEILTGDYKEITHKAVFVKYQVKDKENEYLLIWTTTPWTLPANVAIAVDPDIDYVRVKTSEGVLILAKTQVKEVIGEDAQILGELKGNKLIGLKYLGLYDDLPIIKKSAKEHLIVAWEEGVSEKEGTGLVHVSTGSGPEDYDLGKEIGLPVFPVIDGEGNYLKGYGLLEGKNVSGAVNEIIADLKKKSALFKEQDFTHRYPLCWRCKTELLFRLVDEWYISMDELRHRMMEITKQIRWIPEFGLKMELDWLKNMDDWLISKKRYWGLCLPIWECVCGHFEVIGSKRELKEKAVESWDQFEVHSPHRPWADKVKIKCPKCGKIVSRIPDVGNPWLDAGIVAYSTIKYFEDKGYWQKWFPADLVLECFPGQFKNWFYSLIAMSAALESRPPFEVLLGHALVKDENGREMHKSWGNAIEFNEAADEMGADVMRWIYSKQNPKLNLNFGYGPAEEAKREFLLILWNCVKFFLDYASTEIRDKESENLESGISENGLDKWILSRLNSLIRFVTRKLDSFDHVPAAIAIENFVVNDLSTWYIRRSRGRIGPSVQDGRDKTDCYTTLYQVLISLIKALSPFLPFLTEKLWHNLGKEESIHIQDWPCFDRKLIQEDLEKQMEMIRKICSLGHSIRRELKIRTKQPLRAIKIESLTSRPNEDLVNLIKEELNVKKAYFVESIEDGGEKWIRKGEGDIMIALNTEITPELEEEGIVREIIRFIQQLRKQGNYEPVHRISISYQAADKLREVITKNQQFIASRTIAQEITPFLEKGKSFDIEKKGRINGQDFWVGIRKL